MDFLKSKVGKLILLVAAILGLSAPLAYKMYSPTDTDFTPASAVEILGPEQAEVGELVRLKAPGENVKWQLIPESNDAQVYGDNNENLNVSFRTSGRYLFIAASISEGGDPVLATLQITVGSNPGPEPVPGPNNPVTPTEPVKNTELVNAVTQWAQKANLPKETASQLARNFSTVAQEAATGSLTSPGELIKRTGSLNSTLSQVPELAPFMGELQRYLTQQGEANSLNNLEQHRAVWAAIAAGLTNYAK